MHFGGAKFDREWTKQCMVVWRSFTLLRGAHKLLPIYRFYSLSFEFHWLKIYHLVLVLWVSCSLVFSSSGGLLHGYTHHLLLLYVEGGRPAVDSHTSISPFRGPPRLSHCMMSLPQCTMWLKQDHWPSWRWSRIPHTGRVTWKERRILHKAPQDAR